MDLAWVRKAVRVQHRDHVTGAGRKPRVQRVALPLARLLDDLHLGPQPPRLGRRAIGGVSVHEQNLVQPGREPGEHVGEVPRLVTRGDHDAHAHGGRSESHRHAGEDLIVSDERPAPLFNVTGHQHAPTCQSDDRHTVGLYLPLDQFQ